MMSTETNPISPERFALALESLPLDALHAKVAEIRNSISHLRSSNEQMMPFADEGDQDCKEAMFENLTVIGRMNERIELIRREVEGRGMLWGDAEDEAATSLKDEHSIVNGDAPVTNGAVNGTRQPSGRLTDDELRQQLEARMAEDNDDENDDGVHL